MKREIESHKERCAVVERMAASIPTQPPSELDLLFLLARYVKDLENRIFDPTK